MEELAQTAPYEGRVSQSDTVQRDKVGDVADCVTKLIDLEDENETKMHTKESDSFKERCNGVDINTSDCQINNSLTNCDIESVHCDQSDVVNVNKEKVFEPPDSEPEEKQQQCTDDSETRANTDSDSAALCTASAPDLYSEPIVMEECAAASDALHSAAESDAAAHCTTAVSPKLLNPFVHRIHFRFPYDYIKVAILTVVVVPLRMLGILSSLIIAYVVASLGLYGVSREDLSARPLQGWRGIAKDVVCWWVWQVCVFTGFQRTVTRGRRATPKEAPVLVIAPHSSYFDTLPVVAVGAPSVVAKGEIHYIPVLGKYIDYTQPVYVWRESNNSRQKTIEEIKFRASSEYDWPQVMVFPEGTCTNRTCLITFKPGAFYPGVPVQPIVVRYPNSMDTTTWTWDGPGALKLLWLTMAQFHNYCEIEYLPIYTPSEEEKADAQLYAANVRAVMAKALGVPVVDYTYDDCRLMHKARLKNLPPHIGLVEFQKLRQKLRFTLKEAEDCLVQQFAAMARRDGTVTLQGLAQYLAIPETEPELVHLYNLYDRSNRGHISFREYLLGYYEIVKAANTEAALQVAFGLLDSGGSGNVTEAGLGEVLTAALQLTNDEASRIFKEVDTHGRGFITYEDFVAHSQQKGELAWLLSRYQASVEAGTRQAGYRRPPPAPGKAKTE